WLVLALLAPAAKGEEISQQFNYEDWISRWEAQTGEVVTPSAKETALKAIAMEFSSTASAAGISRDDSSMVALAIEDAGDFSVSPKGVIAKSEAGEVRFTWNNAQFAAIANTLNPELVSLQLEPLPIVTVVVDPAPPIDYLIEINGERVRTTDKGRYRVDIGDVVVLVTRASRQDCLWRGNLKAREEQQVACKL
ncbi:MAG: hypothetical protein H5U11_07600, partial [Rhizobium sp.]|nr:hypothetical protein [Rhizobium sp.]